MKRGWQLLFFKKKKKQTDIDGARAQGVHTAVPMAGYYAPGQASVHTANYDAPRMARVRSSVDRLEVGSLVGASAIDTASYKSRHYETQVFQEIADDLQVIEMKFHNGMYDAQAMPLVQEFLVEMEKLAQLQVERDAINDERINDIKLANAAAYQAVSEARSQREMGIEAARLAHLERMLPDFEEEEAKQQKRIAKREKKKQKREQKRAERQEAKEAKEAKREEARQRRAEKAGEKEHQRKERQALLDEKHAQQHEAYLQKQRLKMEKAAEKQRLHKEDVNKKLQAIQRLQDEKLAVSQAKVAEDDARAQRAKADAELAKADFEKARVEAAKARAELGELADDVVETPLADSEHLSETPEMESTAVDCDQPLEDAANNDSAESLAESNSSDIEIDPAGDQQHIEPESSASDAAPDSESRR